MSKMVRANECAEPLDARRHRGCRGEQEPQWPDACRDMASRRWISKREEQPFRISRKADCPSGAEDAVMTEPNKALHSRHERHERLAHGMLNGLW